MKKMIMILVWCTLLSLIRSNTANAENYEQYKFIIQYNVTKKGVWITKIISYENKGVETQNIPSTIEGKPVYRLGAYGDVTDSNRCGEGESGNNLFGAYIPEESYEVVPHSAMTLMNKIKK